MRFGVCLSSVVLHEHTKPFFSLMLLSLSLSCLKSLREKKKNLFSLSLSMRGWVLAWQEERKKEKNQTVQLGYFYTFLYLYVCAGIYRLLSRYIDVCRLSESNVCTPPYPVDTPADLDTHALLSLDSSPHACTIDRYTIELARKSYRSMPTGLQRHPFTSSS